MHSELPKTRIVRPYMQRFHIIHLFMNLRPFPFPPKFSFQMDFRNTTQVMKGLRAILHTLCSRFHTIYLSRNCGDCLNELYVLYADLPVAIVGSGFVEMFDAFSMVLLEVPDANVATRPFGQRVFIL